VQRLVDGLRGTVEAFVEQRDDLLLLLGCSDDDAAIAAKVVSDAEQANGTDVFLLFTDDFVLADPYVAVLAERVAEEHRAACAALGEEGREPLPPPPIALFDEALPPAQRLYAGMAYARSLLPAGGGHRLVWAMCPQRIADRRAWLELAGTFAPRGGVEPWMRGLRLVVRDLPDTAAFALGLTALPRIRTVAADFGPAALQQALQEEADDDAQPLDARVRAHLMLTAIHAAHGRTEQAVAGYYDLLGRYQEANDLPMQAFVINALGDLWRRGGDLETAQQWYECAAVPAAEAADPVQLATVTRSLGSLALERGDPATAEQYYAQLDRLAGHMLAVELKVEALQQRGRCLEAMGQPDEALARWEDAATLARATGEAPVGHRAVLEELRRGYEARGAYGRLAAVEAELAALAAGGA
jgi:tetratricopeptide (TPR) repeat protein